MKRKATFTVPGFPNIRLDRDQPVTDDGKTTRPFGKEAAHQLGHGVPPERSLDNANAHHVAGVDRPQASGEQGILLEGIRVENHSTNNDQYTLDATGQLDKRR